MSAMAKVYLWKDGKAVKTADNLKVKIVDTATGEFVVEGLDIGVFYQHMFILQSNNNNTTEKKEVTND